MLYIKDLNSQATSGTVYSSIVDEGHTQDGKFELIENETREKN